MAQQTPVSPDDFRDPTGQRQLYIIRQLLSRLSALESAQTKNVPELDRQQLDQIATFAQRDLSVTGRHPLPLTGLVGRTADTQLAAPLVFPDAITNHDPKLYPVGTLATASGALYYVKDGVPHTWGSITFSSPTNMVTTDTVQTVGPGAAKTLRDTLTLNPSSGAALAISAGQFNSTSQFAASVYPSTNTSVNDSTFTSIPFDSETFDRGACHSTSTNTSRITIPSGGAGLILIIGQLEFTANATGSRSLRLLLNGVTTIGGVYMSTPGTDILVLQGVTLIVVADADYVEMQAYQSSGGALNVIGGATATFLSFVKIC